MTIDPENSHRHPPNGARQRRHGMIILVGVLVVLFGVALMFMGGTSDNVNDPAAQSQLPPDPTEMQDQQAPAITDSSDLPSTDTTGSTANGGMAPQPGDTAAPVGPAPAAPAQ